MTVKRLLQVGELRLIHMGVDDAGAVDSDFQFLTDLAKSVGQPPEVETGAAEGRFRLRPCLPRTTSWCSETHSAQEGFTNAQNAACSSPHAQDVSLSVARAARTE